MLSPDYLKYIPESLVAIYEEIEDEILKDIARRIKKTGYLAGTAERQIEVLMSGGNDLNMLKKKLKPLLNKANKEMEHIISESSILHYNDELEAYRSIGKALGTYSNNGNIIKQVAVIKERLRDNLNNLTKTLGVPIGNKYTVLDVLYKRDLTKSIIMIQSDAFSSKTIARITIEIAEASSKLGCSPPITFQICTASVVPLLFHAGLSTIAVPIVKIKAADSPIILLIDNKVALKIPGRAFGMIILYIV